MKITISKNDFEAALPVGTAAHDEVYESVLPAISRQLSLDNDTLLGTAGMDVLESYGDEESTLLNMYKQLVCLDAFLSVLRQLDLVLTPTGFGVVSNENVAPASKQRVDALEAQLRTQRYRTLALTVNMLRSEAWGTTAQARRALPHLYDAYTYFFETHQGASSADWDAYRQTIDDADEMLRTKIGDRQMEDILDAFRRGDAGRMEPYREVMSLIVKFTDTWAVRGAATLKKPVYRRLMRILDSEEGKEFFKLYRESAAYKANHHEVYRNTKDSTAFVFGG